MEQNPPNRRLPNPPSHLLPTVAPRDCMYKGYNMTAKVKVVPLEPT